MKVSYNLQVDRDELITIMCALQNVEYWHKSVIARGISIVAHEKLISKNAKLVEKIREFKDAED